MAIDNATVHVWAQQALDKYKKIWGVRERLYLAAFEYLYAKREEGYCFDDSLAAASHYMHMRWAAATLGPGFKPVFVAMVISYDGLWKAVDLLVTKATGKKTIPRTGGCEPSPFNPLLVAWALRGIQDGCVDFIFHWGSAELEAPSLPLLFVPPSG